MIKYNFSSDYVEDLNGGNFTIDINLYIFSIGTDSILSVNDEDDEEVFFGPQTLNEKIAAKVVNEEEALTAPPTEIDPAMRALIFRDAAQVQLALKHGTTKKKNSPIAIVRPMRKEDNIIDFLNPKTVGQNDVSLKGDKENLDPTITKLKPIAISNPAVKSLQPSFQSKLAKGLPTSKLRPMGQSKLAKNSQRQCTEQAENVNLLAKKVTDLELSSAGQRSNSAPTPTSRLPAAGNKSLKVKAGNFDLVDVAVFVETIFLLFAGFDLLGNFSFKSNHSVGPFD